MFSFKELFLLCVFLHLTISFIGIKYTKLRWQDMWISFFMGIPVYVILLICAFLIQVIVVENDFTDKITYNKYYLFRHKEIHVKDNLFIDTKSIKNLNIFVFNVFVANPTKVGTIIINKTNHPLKIEEYHYSQLPEAKYDFMDVVNIKPFSYTAFINEISYFFDYNKPPQRFKSSSSKENLYWLQINE